MPSPVDPETLTRGSAGRGGAWPGTLATTIPGAKVGSFATTASLPGSIVTERDPLERGVLAPDDRRLDRPLPARLPSLEPRAEALLEPSLEPLALPLALPFALPFALPGRLLARDPARDPARLPGRLMPGVPGTELPPHWPPRSSLSLPCKTHAGLKKAACRKIARQAEHL